MLSLKYQIEGDEIMEIAKIVKCPNSGKLNGEWVETFDVKFLVENGSGYFKKTEKLEIKDGTFHWVEKNGFVSFGYDSNWEKTGHGGLWSSNSKAFREFVGIETVEVTILSRVSELGGSVIHMRKDVLENVLPNEYKVVRLDSGFDSVIQA